MDLVKNALKRIGGNNKSKHEIEYFIKCLEILWLGETEGDWEDYVMHGFLADNGRDTDKIRYDDVFKEFLGVGRKEKDGYEEGPYGGAFSSWDDYYNWKEG